jgi:hypothetical protein
MTNTDARHLPLYEVLHTDKLAFTRAVLGLANSCSCGNSGNNSKSVEASEALPEGVDAGIRVRTELLEDLQDAQDDDGKPPS